MEYEINLNGTKWGTVSVKRDGEFMDFDGSAPFREGIYRLYMLSDSAVFPLGVMMPEAGMLTIHRRARAAMLPGGGAFLRAAACEGDTEPDIGETYFSPFDERWTPSGSPGELSDDEVLHAGLEKCSGVLYAYSGGRAEVAVPEEQHENISCALCFARPETIRGRKYYVLRLGGEGMPVQIL